VDPEDYGVYAHLSLRDIHTGRTFPPSPNRQGIFHSAHREKTPFSARGRVAYHEAGARLDGQAQRVNGAASFVVS
jgi:hypothetical protein